MNKPFLTILFLVASVSLGHAGVVLVDQDHLSGTGSLGSGGLSNGSDFGRSQTFTVGLAGVLDSVEVDIANEVPTLIQILDTSGGTPIGGASGSVILASSSSVTSAGDVHTFDLSSSGLVVNVGDVLAIEVFGTGAWRHHSGGASYAGGNDFFQHSWRHR